MSPALDSPVLCPRAFRVRYRSSCRASSSPPGAACTHLWLGAGPAPSFSGGSLLPSLGSHLDSECGPSAFDFILSSLGTEESQQVPGGAQANSLDVRVDPVGLQAMAKVPPSPDRHKSHWLSLAPVHGAAYSFTGMERSSVSWGPHTGPPVFATGLRKWSFSRAPR